MRLFVIALVASFLMMSSCILGQTADVEVTFNWTAPGDDANVGTASQYDFRLSTDSTALFNDWATGTVIPGVPAPQVAGSAESYTVTLTFTIGEYYYFAIKAADEVPNWSPISNFAVRYIPDNVAPAMIIDLGILP